MVKTLLSAVEIEPPLPANASIIWLHGLGSDGHDFSPIVPQIRLSNNIQLRFVFPHAPIRPVTLNGGMQMRAWYDIFALGEDLHEKGEDIRESALLLNQLIQREEEKGIPSNRIVLAGFSQGGAVVLHCGLRYPKPLAGILALSAYLPLNETVAVEASSANKIIPILFANGTYDNIVLPEWGEGGYQKLIELGYPAKLNFYPMEHSVCDEEIRDIVKWLNEVIR
jgi:phospholipase/carboxylesterase